MVSFIYKEQNRKSPSILRASAQIWENTFELTYITTIPLNENKRGGVPSSGMDRRGIAEEEEAVVDFVETERQTRLPDSICDRVSFTVNPNPEHSYLVL